MDEAPIAWHPLEPLRDDAQIRDLFARILLQRLDTEILAGHFGVADSPAQVRVGDRWLSKPQFVGELVSFLVESAQVEPGAAARSFWEAFKEPGWRFPGVPSEASTSLTAYFEIKEDVTDLEMFRDLVDPKIVKAGVIADIGCGRNKLGPALLRHSDAGSGVVREVIGSDIEPYDAEATDPRLSFLLQEGPDLPIGDSSVDVAILKWALHHMTRTQINAQLREVRRILRPGGTVAVVEGLVGSWADLSDMLGQEATNDRSWPPGPWVTRRMAFTEAFLRLTEVQQAQLLALEDYHGHWLEQEFVWMPLPFNYMSTAAWTEAFAAAGLVAVSELTRVLGMAPMIHWGPPSIRYVFRRPNE